MNKLMQLLRDNAARNEAPKIRSAVGDGCVDIYVYDVIDPYWGATAAGLIDALKAAAGQPVCLHINSPGGDVFEGRAMAAAIAAYSGKVEACVDGVCASAATYLALAAGTVCMVDGALFMVHNSWTIAYGDKTALRQTADLIEKIDGTIAADYMRKTKASAEQVKTWMDAETWFTGTEALAAGFIDAVEPNTQRGDQAEEAAAARWNLAAYANAPKVEPRGPTPAEAQALRDQLAAQASAQLQANRNRLRLFTPI
jgi:ATP-dependent protease ClpP protease subunit